MTREDILNRKSKTKEITVDDLTVNIRKLTQAEVETARREYGKPDKALEGYRYVVSRAVVDAEGQRVFKDDDKAKLCEVDYEIVEGIAAEIIEYSGVNKPDPKSNSAD